MQKRFVPLKFEQRDVRFRPARKGIATARTR
jgi:hypothetical protein